MEANNRTTPSRTIILVALVISGYCCSLTGAITLVRRDQPVEPADGTIVTAKTTSGLLRGIRQQTGFHQQMGSIIKFLSVPYAEAPIGSLRFKRPVELSAQRSKQVLNASQYGKTCPQYRHLTQFISPLLNIDDDHQISEDCLQLNIFVPASVDSNSHQHNHLHQQQLEPVKQLPVIVWIPGEGFDFADARQFEGSNLALKTQSIVVTVQYRVGVLGFLHAPELNITGNMGVYDQIMALKWIRKNIDQFGGDSERVTLMGRFSGSMSISTMITAPKHQSLLKVDGRLLFNRVALISGIAVEDWIIDSSQHERVSGLEEAALAKQYCNLDQISSGSCLSAMSVEQLMRVANYGWRLVRDDELIGEQSPVEAVKSGSFVSDLEGVLLGETGMEGTLCMYRHALDSRPTNYRQLIEEDKLTSDDLYSIIRDDSQTYFNYSPNKTNPIELALEALLESADSEQIESAKLREKYLNACSAYMVKSHTNRFKRNLLARNQQLINRMDSGKRATEVHHYELRYKPSFSLAPDYIKLAAHGDDIPLIFGLVYNHQPKAEINEPDLLMTRKMMSYIGNFVHGNQPLLADSAGSIINNETSTSMDDGDSDGQQQLPSASLSTGNIRPRSWATEGQLHFMEFDESDLQELNARRRRQQQQRQSSNGSPSGQLVQLAHGNNNNADLEVDGKPGMGVDKSLNIRLILVDGINQVGRQQEANELFVQRRRQPDRQTPSSSSATINSQQPQPQLASQQTNMTLINESSFVTILLFGTCLVMFALMSTCLGLCLIIFRGSTHPGNFMKQNVAPIQQQHYVNSSTSSCDICEESQGGSIDVVLGGARAKDVRAFSNVFAKLRNNQASQSHHHPQQPQQQQQQQQQQQVHIDGQSCKQIE